MWSSRTLRREPTVNPHHLRSFLAVFRHLNYTRAGEELFLSQPAVSRQIKQLEGDLGVRLIEQIGKSLLPTDAGRALATEAERLLGAMERAAESVRAHMSATHGSLRLGASSTPGFYLVPEVLGRFHRSHPSVDLHYVVENSLRIEQMLLRNELDLGFVGARLSSGDIHHERILEDQIVCFTSPGHPLAQRQVTTQDLADEMRVSREQGSATRRLFEEWLTARGTRLGRSIELRCPEAVKVLVAAGIGYSAISAFAITSELRAGRLVQLVLKDLVLRRPIYLVHHREKHNSPVMREFLSLARAELKPLGEGSSSLSE